MVMGSGVCVLILLKVHIIFFLTAAVASPHVVGGGHEYDGETNETDDSEGCSHGTCVLPETMGKRSGMSAKMKGSGGNAWKLTLC